MMTRLKLGSAHSGWATTVWIDPGGTTGWGVMSIDPLDLIGDKPIHECIAHWACGDIHGNENQMASEVMELYSVWEDAAIGIESFLIRKFLQHAEFLSPVRIRSKVEYALWLQEKWASQEESRAVGRGRHLFIQSPADAKNTLNNDRQRDYGLWEPGPDHKRDAVKHCYLFLSRMRAKPKARYYAWPKLFKTNGEPLRRLPPSTKRDRY